MNDELRQFQPQVLAILGALMQYARGHARFPEWAYHLSAALLALLGYALFAQVMYPDWRETVIRGLVGVSGSILSVWGGTFVASNSAKAGVPVFPVTNSKGGNQ